MENRQATIVTFYSYKGGVGRSMALANVAWALAEKYNRKVLVIDWDLEAPGLHRFFELEDGDIERGLIDLLYDYKDLLKGTPQSLPEQLVNVGKYIRPVEHFKGGGSISLLAAGRQDKMYARRINEFSWDEFYAKWHGFGFIEHLKQELKAFNGTEIILVDSRTGVTDIGGICTLQLPDAVVLLFALNEQNIRGAESVAEKISRKATEIEGREHPPILIIRPSRVEGRGNQDEKIKWRDFAALRLGDYLSDDDRTDARRFIEKKNIPYIGDYSYGETPLAVQKDPLGEMAESFMDLAESILDVVGKVREGRLSSARQSSGLNYWSKKLSLLLMKRKNVYLIVLALVLISVSVFSLIKVARLNKQLELVLADAQLVNARSAERSDVSNKEMESLKIQLEDQQAQNSILGSDLLGGTRRLAVLLAFHLKERNIPFVLGGRKPETGLDLSGFIDYILSQPQIGLIKNPENCDQQCLMNSFVKAEKLDELKPGDLIFYENQHTMMYLGKNKCIGMIYLETIEVKDISDGKAIGYGKVPYGE
jgi:MinD-like ATPase involved in chromosome partitioning or flagellar assembly